MKDSILSIIRHLLTFGGGYVAAQGWATQDELTTGISALITLIGVIWGIVDKHNRPTTP